MHEYNSIIKNDALILINGLLCIIPIKSNVDFKGIACFWGLAWETQGPLWRGDVIWPKAWTLTLMTSSTSLSNGQPLGHLLGLPPLSVGPIEHLDLKNTILQGDLTKVVYMHHPTNQLLMYPTNEIRCATSNKPSTYYTKLLDFGAILFTPILTRPHPELLWAQSLFPSHKRWSLSFSYSSM